MVDSSLLTKILDDWEMLRMQIHDHKSDGEYVLNIFVDCDIDNKSHILWSVPLTLYQLMRQHNDELADDLADKLADKYGMNNLLFVLAYIYVKYNRDDATYVDQVKKQWCTINNKLHLSTIHKIELKLLEMMDFSLEDTYMCSGDIYEKTLSSQESMVKELNDYSITDAREKRKYLRSLLENTLTE